MKVKFSGVIHFAEGFYYLINGLTNRVDDRTASLRFYGMAIERFEEALDSNPNNKDILVNMALTWTLALEDEYKIELAQRLYINKDNAAVSKAMEYYLRAISAEPKYDSHSLYLYAHFLEMCGNEEASEDYYLQSMEAEPNNACCLYQYGNFLSKKGLEGDAEKFYLRSSQNTKGMRYLEWNYWGSPKTHNKISII